CVDFKKYFARFAELCPGVPVHIETISGFPREVAYFKKDFWNVWPKARAKDLAKFVALAKKGHSIPPSKSANDPEYQQGEIERSIKYCKEVLGLGLK
ncbi:MAG: Xylose isomerase-like barrel, partial [Verrucomicrobiales bacterium]|nr:Xylose isomerase-like barrel [Verrucomicrobiales bacterium]